MEHFYPARVLKVSYFSDHLPVILPITCDLGSQEHEPAEKLRLEKLTEETWGLRSGELASYLMLALPLVKLHSPTTNAAHLIKILSMAINHVFSAERKKPKKRLEKDPFERFLMSNINHPEMAELLTAIEERKIDECEKKIRRIGADG